MVKKITTYFFYVSFLLLFLANKSDAQFYTGSFQEFGKNRVQEVTFFWQYYDYERFRVFFYGNGKEHAEYVSRSAHQNLKELELFFETELDEKLDILVFNRQSDFKQSNIGLTNEITSNIGGKTNIIGTKMFVYFEEDHTTFDEQIRAALSQVIVNKMVYQSNWKKVVRGSSTIDLPNWFTEGLYSYKSKNWDSEIDNLVKDNILANNYDRLGRIEPEEARVAGHAMWHYIAQVYGDEVIPQILYLVSISKSFESSFRFVLGKSTRALNADFVAYYKKQYQKDEAQRKLPNQDFIKLKSRKKKGKITQYKISPDGNKIAYTTNELGKYYVWIYDIKADKYTKVLKKGYKINRKEDESYPLIDWHPNGETLAFVDEREGAVFFNFYDLASKKKNSVQVQKISKITSFNYNHTGTQFAFTGLEKGQIDLYIYTILGNGYLRLTNDFYDEKDPSFIEDSKKIIFSSNRKNDSLFVKVDRKPFPYKYDLYIYDLEKRFQARLKRVTNTPNVDEFQAFEIGDKKFTYTSDENGITNRYLAVFDSTISSVDTAITYRYYSKSSILTDYKRNILKLDYSAQSQKIGLLMYHEGEYGVYVGEQSIDKMIASNVSNTYSQDVENENFEDQQKESTVEIISYQALGKDSIIATKNYRFASEEKKPKGVKVQDSVAQQKKETSGLVFMNPKNNPTVTAPQEDEEFVLPTRKLYKINFTLDEVTSQLDNNFLNNSYQVFNPNQPTFNNPNFNLFNMVQMKDLMEDYRLIGGVNLSFNFRDNDYLLVYEDLSQRFDKKYMFSRQVYSNEDGIYPVRTMIHEARYRVKYPFNEVSAIGVTLNFRNDLTVTSSVDRTSLERDNLTRNMGGIKVDYIFDNTFEKGINLREGTRLKLFGEFYHEIYEEQTDFFVLGADIRNYQKIHRELIFASRFAASTSFGNRKLVYFMGGVDGGFNPQFNQSNIVPLDQGFAFQTIATPMRGFIQNTRFGNSFAVINTELRWPVFQYFSEYPVQSKFLASFQIVGFGDAGTAWTGPNPYSVENSFNRSEISQKPLNIIIENQREPIIFGYGIGLRAELFGYFVRYDWSWGIEDGVNQGRVNYLSLSLDF